MCVPVTWSHICPAPTATSAALEAQGGPGGSGRKVAELAGTTFWKHLSNVCAGGGHRE